MVAISASAGTALAFAAVRYYQGKQPQLLFSVFKIICRLDNSISVDVDEFRARASAILAYPYKDVRYTDWRESLVRRDNRWTAMEWLVLDTQMYEEQQLGRLEQRRLHLNALREKQLEFENQGSKSDL